MGFYDKKRQATGCLPIGVVLTIAATGSEMSNSSVITKEDGWIKRGYRNDYGRPRFAIMNPELTMTLPDYQTACGCTDIPDAYDGTLFYKWWKYGDHRQYCRGSDAYGN